MPSKPMGILSAQEPSLRDRIAFGIGGLLGGDNYRQGNTARKIGGLLDFIPGVGDAIGVDDTKRAAQSGDWLGAGVNLGATVLGAAPVVGDMAGKGLKKAMRGYPAEMPPIYSDMDFAARGGQVANTTPDDFLSKVRPLDLDDESIENIAELRRHVEQGGRLDPPVIYVENGEIVKHDGRHRAHLAKQMGMSELPVIVIDTSGAAATTDIAALTAQTKKNR